MKVRLQITAVTRSETLETENYADEWHEKCDEDGHEEGNDYPPVPREFAIERFQTALEDGDIGLDEVMDSATIDVKEIQ